MSVYSLLKPFFDDKSRVVSISGSSGTGKTTLALQIVARSMIISHESNVPQCLWIQASEKYSKKRLEAMINGKDVHLILKNTFLIPGARNFSSFEELFEQLQELPTKIIPPNTKFVVIDNISHHLRYKLSQIDDINARSKLINLFFDNVLFPLIMWCSREGITLIIIHEVSQNPSTGKTHPFYHKLFNRIQSISITLNRSSFGNPARIEIEDRGQHISEPYYLVDEGLFFRIK